MEKAHIGLKTIVLPKVTLTLLEPSIIRMEMAEGEIIEVEDLLEMQKANLELTGTTKYCVLIDASKRFFSTSPEARELTADAEFSKYREATALLVGSVATKLAGNFFIQFNKPSRPTKIFSEVNEALEWLRSYLS